MGKKKFAGFRVTAALAITITLLFLTGCKPQASFTADPAVILAGQTTTLSWSSQYATHAGIDQGIGSVPLKGSITVAPTQTTTYTLTVTNDKEESTIFQARLRL
jgi:hypothetical protein